METHGQLIVPTEISMTYAKLPEQLRPARKFFGPDPTHTAAIGIKVKGINYFIPLDADEIKMLLEGLEKIMQQPLQEPRIVIAATEVPGEKN